MAVPQHLNVLNTSFCSIGEGTFEPFPRLALELRLQIWQYALEKNRLVQIDVEPEWHANDDTGNLAQSETLLYSTTNSLNKLISGSDYRVTVEGFQIHSKLLRVNRESRQLALRFYRVHIPCYLRTGELKTEKITRATVYLNPEYDFIQLSSAAVKEVFSDFLHDLQAHDPRNIGLLNLVLESGAMRRLHEITDLAPEAKRKSFVTLMSQVKEIIWLAQSHCGRRIVGRLQGFPEAGNRFNHSMPVMARNPVFSIYREPRPIEPELQFVLTGSCDPREMRVGWRQMLQRWDIGPPHPARERVAFAYNLLSSETDIVNIETAKEFLKGEADAWPRCLENLEKKKWPESFIGKVPTYSAEDFAKAVQPAIGFWLFPAEALGSLDDDLSHMKKTFDLRGHWPELALANIF